MEAVVTDNKHIRAKWIKNHAGNWKGIITFKTEEETERQAKIDDEIARKKEEEATCTLL